ncbi:MAG TPA: DUF1849 family protein [Rhodospirillales bacterium]|jgi:hypothetical protein|nr:DUF1849 family protein [Rhodospirillales bacterium]
MISFRDSRYPAVLAAAILAVFYGGPLAAAELAAHRAIYSLKLGETRNDGKFIKAHGALMTVMEKSCDGWIMAQTLKMDLDTIEGTTINQDMRYTSWESFDGGTYRFFSHNHSGRGRDEFKGQATTSQDDGHGEAIFKLPGNKTIPLPEGTLFPISHLAWLIDRAMAGERQVPRFLFDGADDEGPQQVFTFIGPKVTSSKNGITVLGSLTDRPGWSMSMAFFPAGSPQSKPEYEMEVLQLDNGVTPRIVLDYDNFSVILDLQKIEAVPSPPC